MSFYNDNSVPFGSKVITIGGVAYVAEHISLSRPSHIIERKDQIGEPNGWVGTKGFDHGSCTLQIATEDTAYPARGDTFTMDGIDGTWVIVDTTEPFAQADYFKVNATIRLAQFAA